jgi:hypothetical protein
VEFDYWKFIFGSAACVRRLRRMKNLFMILSLAGVVVLAGCAKEEPVATPPPVSTNAPAAP